MVNTKFLYILTCYIVLILPVTSCKKNIPITHPNPIALDDTDDKERSVLPKEVFPPDAKIYNVGNGAGELMIDGANYICDQNIVIIIKAGTYKKITLSNLIGSKEKRIYITNGGEVKISEVMRTSNLKNVTLTGDNLNGSEYGFKFQNIPYRAIIMEGKIDGVTLKNLSFRNVTDFSIIGGKGNGMNFPYKGTRDTRSEDLKVLNCWFENAGSIIFGGALDGESGEDSGFFKNVEISYNIFKDSKNVASVCYISNVQDYNIHHNIVNNINQLNNNHNGVFWMQGNGKFHHNKLTNYQGNAIRAWLYSRGSKPSTVEIYQNICYNTTKYGAFELQSFKRNIVNGTSTYANARVYNNTCLLYTSPSPRDA
eukprot:TRINITY_DN3368_c0_g2_i1.p1 TRINITY_DN3368_c0_g2~~TRINITY_DN3368_c0_g2_i1.p1  ORF type:complete len:368 (+),score=-1.43 TRINITY_DN3368_c0_g2_i1:170-1273(+)